MPRVVVLNDARELLLVRHNHRTTARRECFWVVPGGAVEPGETSLEAAIREVREETGIEVEILRLLWLVEETGAAGGGSSSQAYFLGIPRGGELRVGGDPEMAPEDQVIDDARFIARAEVASLDRIYPEIMRSEFWRLLDAGEIRLERERHPTYRLRPSPGFGAPT
jgi:8-oxo-dGTP diphosphatase